MPDQNLLGKDFTIDDLLQQSMDDEGCGSLFAAYWGLSQPHPSQRSLDDLPMSDLIHCIALQSSEKLENSIFCECGAFFGAIHAEISRQDKPAEEGVAAAA